MYIKTSQDYKRELNVAKSELQILKIRIADRFFELCERNPNMEIPFPATDKINTLRTTTNNVLSYHSPNYEMAETYLVLIKYIEDQLSLKYNGVQTKLIFPNE